VFTGRLGCTSSRNGKVNSSATGAKSRFGSTGDLVKTNGARIVWLFEHISSVCPSGAERATATQPIAPDAPGMFSGTKLCPNTLL
jgi:hypothetical protein